MTITTRLPTELEAELRAEVAARGTKVSDFVRDAIVEKLDREGRGALIARESGMNLFGRHGSGRDDLSTNRKAILAELLRAKHSR